MKRVKRQRYEVMVVDKWHIARHGTPQPSGWLEYELRDGTVGLCPPSKWRLLAMDVVRDGG